MPRLAFRLVFLSITFNLGWFSSPVLAASPIFVRNDGSDALCNGTVNAPASAAPNCAVQSFSQGVSLVDVGGVVNVGPGAYTESATVTINKSLTLRGPQAGVDARSRTVPAAAEAIFNVDPTVLWGLLIDADNVTIDGFTIRGADNPVTDGSLKEFNTGSGHVVVNNIFEDNLIAYYPANDGVIPSRVQFNLFRNNNFSRVMGFVGTPIYVEFPFSNTLIESNSFTNNTLNCSINVVEGALKSDVTIHDNFFQGNLGGICFAFGRNLVIQGNQILDSLRTGITLNGNVVGADISQNIIRNSGVGAVNVRDYCVDNNCTPLGANDDISLIQNMVVDNQAGIRVGTQALTASLNLAFNRIFNNTDFGLANASSVTLGAENNWWGCNAGPNDPAGDCDTATGPADLDVWLTLRLLPDPTSILSNGSSALTSDLLQNSEGVDTSSMGHIPDDTPVSFSSSFGSVTPVDTVTSSGQANSSFSPNGATGDAQVCTTVDNQTVCVTLPVTTPAPTFVGCLQGSGSLGASGAANCLGGACSLSVGVEAVENNLIYFWVIFSLFVMGIKRTLSR